MGIMDWFKRAPAQQAEFTPPSEPPVPFPVRQEEEPAPVAPGADWRATSDYMAPELAKSLLIPGPDGRLPVRLVPRKGQLVFVIDGHKQIVSTTHPSLTKHGIFAGNVMGTNYHRTAAKQGHFAPGSPVVLKREPGNKHDVNAVAVMAKGAASIVGYVNKGKAARLAKLLDSGVEMVAVALDGEGSGHFTGQKITFVASSPDVLAHLLRRK
jgi:hypothetical protein